MSIDNPPIYEGITYNSAFFVQDAGGLSEAQANLLYLRKTVTDTATALETFNSGVATASISSTSSATNMTIGSNLAASQTLTLGSAGTITTNNGTLQAQTIVAVTPASNLTIGATSSAGIDIGNAGVSTTNLYGTVKAGTIDAFTTTGTLNLGQNLTSGTVNISTGASSSTAVSIATRGASSTNAVRIGNVTNSTYLDSDTVAVGVLGLTGSGAISIATGTNTAGAQVSIGSVSLTAVNIKGVQTNLETTTLNLNTAGVGNTLLGTVGGSNSITLNRPLSTTFAYSYISTMPNQIGARVDVGGSGGASITVTGDGQWRNYFYVNNVPQGVYMFQYWANPGGATYSGVTTQIYQRASVFTATGTVLSGTVFTSQLYTNLLINLTNPSNAQTALSSIVYVDASTPNVALALQCTTAPVSFSTFHGLQLWRIA